MVDRTGVALVRGATGGGEDVTGTGRLEVGEAAGAGGTGAAVVIGAAVVVVAAAEVGPAVVAVDDECAVDWGGVLVCVDGDGTVVLSVLDAEPPDVVALVTEEDATESALTTTGSADPAGADIAAA